MKIGILQIVFLLLLSLLIEGCFIDFTPPKILSASPDHQSVVSTDITIDVSFSESMDINSTEVSFQLYSDDGACNGKFDWNTEQTEFTFTPELQLKNGYYYTITLSNDAEDKKGNNLSREFISSFFVGDDLTPPGIESTFPDNLTRNFPLNESITISFTEEMDTMSVERGIRFSPSINGRWEWNSGSSITFHPYENLDFYTDYSISITDDCKDIAGNKLITKTSVFFTAGDEFTRPTITDLRTNPLSAPDADNNFNWAANDSYRTWEGVEKNATLTFTFSEAIDRESFRNAFKLFPDIDKNVIWSSDTTCSVTFVDELKPNETYELRILKSLKDTAGNEMSNDFIIFFKVNGSDSTIPEITSITLRETNSTLIADLLQDEIVEAGIETATDNKYKINLQFNVDMDPVEVHNNITINWVYGEQPELSGAIKYYDWIDSRQLAVTLSSIEGANLYKFTLIGGENGIMSGDGVSLTKDLTYYFIFESND